MKTHALYSLLLTLQVGITTSYTSNNFDLLAAINTDGNNQITESEVLAFFRSLGGGDELTRCQFELPMTKTKGAATTRELSAMFDMMQGQAGNGRTLTAAEFRRAILGNEAALPVGGANQTLNSLYSRIDAGLREPYKTNVGPSTVKYTDFQAGKWGQQADANNDDKLNRNEVSGALRSLDTNGDFGIYRCEFVDEVTARYRANPLAANRLFDRLFKSHEITWADVDSDFLLQAINHGGRQVRDYVTVAQFVEFMNQQNALAAGAVVRTDRGQLQNRNGAFRTVSSLWTVWLGLFGLMLRGRWGIAL